LFNYLIKKIVPHRYYESRSSHVGNTWSLHAFLLTLGLLHVFFMSHDTWFFARVMMDERCKYWHVHQILTTQ